MANKILELLEPSAVCLNLTAADSKEVINHLSKQLLDAGYVRNSFAKMSMLPFHIPISSM